MTRFSTNVNSKKSAGKFQVEIKVAGSPPFVRETLALSEAQAKNNVMYLFAQRTNSSIANLKRQLSLISHTVEVKKDSPT